MSLLVHLEGQVALTAEQLVGIEAGTLLVHGLVTLQTSVVQDSFILAKLPLAGRAEVCSYFHI